MIHFNPQRAAGARHGGLLDEVAIVNSSMLRTIARWMQGNYLEERGEFDARHDHLLGRFRVAARSVRNADDLTAL